MRLKITGRHMELTDSIREYVEKKVGKITKFYDRLSEIEVIVDSEAKKSKVELIVKADNHQPFVVHDSNDDAYACLDSVVDKMERQLKKYKEKSRSHKGHSSAGDVPIIEEEDLDIQEHQAG